MDTKTFFEKFELIADAPDAVAKMRELILHLATTSQLLERTEKPSSKKLQKLATKIGSGATPRGGKQAYVEQGVPLIRSMNVYFSGFRKHGLVFLTDDQAEQLKNVSVCENDVLLNITGASIGRVTLAPRDMDGARVNQHVMIIRTTEELHPRFLAIFLASPRIQLFIDDIQVGATRQALTKSMVQNFEIPLPPLAEQKRIVAKVDELMALCDQLEAQQKESEQRRAELNRAALARFSTQPTVSNINYIFHKSYHIPPADLRKTILTLAVQGKLVPKDPNDEAATKDFEKLLKDRESSELKQPKIDYEEKKTAPSTPPHWLTKRLGEIVSIRTGLAFKSSDYTDKGIFILRVTNINPDGTFDTSDSKFISPEKIDSKIAKYHLTADDILVVMVGGSLGKIGVVTESILPALLNQNMWRIKPFSDSLDLDFLRLVLTDLNENRLKITTSTHGHLAMGSYAASIVPFPPAAEQRRIVAKVDQLMALVDQLEAQLEQSRSTATNLLTALVAELTASNPKEPADTVNS